MKAQSIILLILIIFTNGFLSAGCWNYREVDQLAIVAGAAIDKGIQKKYSLSVEIVDISTGKETEVKSKTFTFEGDSIFEAARNGIAITGKKLYWSHAKILIISEEMARNGIVDVLDWYNRDSETRGDIYFAVSKGIPAKDILMAKGTTNKVKAFELENMLKNENSLSKASRIEIWELTNELSKQGTGATAAAVGLYQSNGVPVPIIWGTAVFKGDKLIGFIDGDDTQDMLFVKDKIKGGILLEKISGTDNSNATASLEIFQSKTRVAPVIINGSIEMNVKVYVTAAIDEIQNTKDIISEDGLKSLEESAGRNLQSQIGRVIKKAQDDLGVDIFNFGTKLREDKPDIWKEVSSNWAEEFQALKVNVKAEVHIKNSAMMSAPLKIGE